MPHLSSENVLVIGDAAERLGVVTSALRQAGYLVSTAPDGLAALEAAERVTPDLILIDVSTPETGGAELCRLIRGTGRLSATPVILVGPPREDARDEEKGLEAGADEYLETPYTLPLLVAKAVRLIERGRSGGAPRKGEDFYRALIENASDLITVLDAEGAIRYQSPALGRALGYAPEELIGRNVFDFIHPEDRPLARRSFDESVAGGGPVRPVARLRHKGGDWRSFVLAPTNLLDDPAVGGAVVNAFDITERVTAEQALSSREEIYRALLQSFPNGSVNIFDRDLRYVMAEGRGLERVGLSSDRLVGKTLDELYPKESVDYVSPYYRRAFEGEEVEFELSTAGQIFSIRAAPLLSHRGEIETILVVADNITARKQHEEERARLAALVESADDAIISETPDGIIASWNKAAERLFGFTAAEVVGGPFSVIAPEEDADLARFRERLTRGERIPSFEAVREAKGGRRVDVFVTVSAIKDEAGRVVGFSRVVRDISERKRTEEKLRESEWQLAEAENLSQLGSWSWDLQSDSVSGSEGIYRIFGVGPHEKRPSALSWFLERIHPDDRSVVEGVFGEAITARRSYETYYRIIRPDGDERVIHERGRMVTDESGAPVKFVGALQDVTESRREQEKLREGEERLRLILEQTPAVIWSVDADLRITFSQGSALEWLGLKQNELVGTSLYEFLRTRALSESPALEAHLKALEGQASGYESEFEGRLYSTRVKPLYVLDGKVAGAVALALDITEYKNAEEQLEYSRERLRALAARLLAVREEESLRISRELHDELGGAMTGLRWDLQSVAEVLAGAEMRGGLRETVAEKVGSMNRLIDSTIQTVRRITSELRPTMLDDLGLVAAVEWQSQQFQARTGIVCAPHVPAESVELSRDRAVAVYRIMQEALTNVLRHARATRVDLFMDRTETEFLLEIRDDGRGIPEEESVGGGSLGLLGMRERAHLVGGEFSISGSPGRGTTVRLSVPL